MEVILQDMMGDLQRLTLKLEQERKEAHEKAMQDIAQAKKDEEERQVVVREVHRLATEKAVQRKNAAAEAEAECLREESVLRVSIEQEENRKQEENERMLRLRASIKRRLQEMEHAEELAKKQLRDILSQAEPKEDTERIMANPLARFFQPQE